MAVTGHSLADLVKDLKNQAKPFQASLDVNAIPNFEYDSDFENALTWVRSKVKNSYTAFPVHDFIKNNPTIKLVQNVPLGEISGYLEQKADYWVIAVNPLHNEGRKRFTIAHEIGHLLFHREYLELQNGPYEEPSILMRSSLFNKVEDQANTFASELLMPRTNFRENWIGDSEDDLKRLADLYEVSTQAVRYKAYKLKLIREY